MLNESIKSKVMKRNTVWPEQNLVGMASCTGLPAARHHTRSSLAPITPGARPMPNMWADKWHMGQVKPGTGFTCRFARIPLRCRAHSDPTFRM